MLFYLRPLENYPRPPGCSFVDLSGRPHPASLVPPRSLRTEARGFPESLINQPMISNHLPPDTASPPFPNKRGHASTRDDPNLNQSTPRPASIDHQAIWIKQAPPVQFLPFSLDYQDVA